MAHKLTVQKAFHARRSRVGFTLLEILIVGTLIALFAGLAILSIQQSYTSATRKAMFDETKSVGQALSMARDDIGFFPRIYLLGTPTSLISFRSAGQTFVRPAMDTYGYLSSSDRAANILRNWAPSYTSISEARRSFAQGIKLLIKMRLPETGYPLDPANVSTALVDWPADIWGHPYVLYQVVSDSNLIQARDANNLYGLRLVNQPSEMGDYFTAVVSYGENGVPGGNTQIEATSAVAQQYRANVLEPASLFVRGDLGAGGATFTAAGQPLYTLKSMNSQYPEASLRSTNQSFSNAFPRSIVSTSGNADEIGIRDVGSDDVFWMF